MDRLILSWVDSDWMNISNVWKYIVRIWLIYKKRASTYGSTVNCEIIFWVNGQPRFAKNAKLQELIQILEFYFFSALKYFWLRASAFSLKSK